LGRGAGCREGLGFILRRKRIRHIHPKVKFAGFRVCRNVDSLILPGPLRLQRVRNLGPFFGEPMRQREKHTFGPARFVAIFKHFTALRSQSQNMEGGGA